MKCFSVASQVAYYVKSRHRAGLNFIQEDRSGLEIVESMIRVQVEYPRRGIDNHALVT